MRNKLIDELEKMIELLHQTGWHKQAVWYENKLKLIKEGEEDCESFYQNLPQGDGEEAEEQGRQRAGQEGGGNGDDHRQGGGRRRARQLLIVERRAQAQGAAHEHHALDAQVQVARLLGEDFAAGAVEQGRAVEDGGRDQVEQKGHFAASFLFWRSSAPRKTSL